MNPTEETTEIAKRPDDRTDIATVSQVQMSQAMMDALKRSGTDIARVQVPDVPQYWPISLEELCVIPSRYRGAVGESPLLVVQAITEFPEAEDFKGYLGYFRAECVTDAGTFVAFTHYLISKDTGEYGPLAQYVRACRVPFLVKIANIQTRAGNNMFRPLPLAAPPQTP